MYEQPFSSPIEHAVCRIMFDLDNHRSSRGLDSDINCWMFYRKFFFLVTFCIFYFFQNELFHKIVFIFASNVWFYSHVLFTN